jgi:hypothetical protein
MEQAEAVGDAVFVADREDEEHRILLYKKSSIILQEVIFQIIPKPKDQAEASIIIKAEGPPDAPYGSRPFH